MTEAISNFFLETVGRELCVFFCSMLPIIELRGAIPLGAALGLPFWANYLISIVGNLLPIPFILLFIKGFLTWCSKCRIKFLNKLANWLFGKVEKHRGKIEKYAFWGLTLFVAIPIPGTGAWTGALVAALIDVKFWRAILCIVIGVLIAGVIMTLISYGAFAFLGIFA